MSEWISSKEAKLAWANDESVGYLADGNVWFVDKNTPLGVFDSFKKWQIKPRTIMLNGIEVPAPDYIVDTPHDYDGTWEINIDGTYLLYKSQKDYGVVVAALRSAFKA